MNYDFKHGKIKLIIASWLIVKIFFNEIVSTQTQVKGWQVWIYYEYDNREISPITLDWAHPVCISVRVQLMVGRGGDCQGTRWVHSRATQLAVSPRQTQHILIKVMNVGHVVTWPNQLCKCYCTWWPGRREVRSRGPRVTLRCLWWRRAVTVLRASGDMWVDLAEVKCRDLESVRIYLQCVRLFPRHNEISFQSASATRKQSVIGSCNGVGCAV